MRASVIGSNSGEIPYFIGDRDCVFEDGDVNGISELLERISTDAEFYARVKSPSKFVLEISTMQWYTKI